MSASEGLIRFHAQPDFPGEDLTEQNTEVLPYLLDIDAVEAQARHLRDFQRPLHATAYAALRDVGIESDYSERSFDAFTQGFATFEVVHMMMRNGSYDGTMASWRSGELFVDDMGAKASFWLPEMSNAWIQQRPNTHYVIVRAGRLEGETPREERMRTIGAFTAFELQRPLFDVA